MTDPLVALPLPEAMERIEASGERLAGVVVTGPQRATERGVPRVVRVRRRPDGIELTVAFPSSPSTEAAHAG